MKKSKIFKSLLIALVIFLQINVVNAEIVITLPETIKEGSVIKPEITGYNFYYQFKPFKDVDTAKINDYNQQIATKRQLISTAETIKTSLQSEYSAKIRNIDAQNSMISGLEQQIRTIETEKVRVTRDYDERIGNVVTEYNHISSGTCRAVEAGSAQARECATVLEDLQHQRTTLEQECHQRLEGLDQELLSVQVEISNARDELSTFEQQAEEMQEQISDQNHAINEYNAQIQSLNSNITAEETVNKYDDTKWINSNGTISTIPSSGKYTLWTKVEYNGTTTYEAAVYTFGASSNGTNNEGGSKDPGTKVENSGNVVIDPNAPTNSPTNSGSTNGSIVDNGASTTNNGSKTDNPKTGTVLSYTAIILGTLLTGTIYYITKKKNKLFRI